VLGLVAAENAFTERCTEHLRDLRDRLYEDMRGYFKEADEEVPYRRGDHLYFHRTERNVPYKIHCRKPVCGSRAPRVKDTEEVEEAVEVILDENVVAEGLQFCDVHSVTPSPGSGEKLVFGVDFNGKYGCAIRNRVEVASMIYSQVPRYTRCASRTSQRASCSRTS
jgi:oligopeptidase B